MELTCYVAQMMRTVFVALALFAGVAHADAYSSNAGKVTIDIPKKWQVKATDDLIRAASPNNQIAFALWVVDSPDLKAALGKLERELYSSVQGLRWVDKMKAVKIHKVPGTWVEGVGMSSRQTQLDILVVVAGPTPTKKGVILMAVVDHHKLALNQKTIRSIFETLKTTK